MRRILTMSMLFSVALMSAAQSLAADPAAGDLKLYATSRVETPEGSGQFECAYKTLNWDPKKTAIIVCDMWDDHWCKSASARVAEMAPRMNEFITAARKQGVLIVHAPSDCMKAYKDHPARLRAKNTPRVDLPDFMRQQCSGLDNEKQVKWPIDQSDGGCDCVTPCPKGRPWTKQIETIKITDDDAISESGVEIASLFAERGIENVMLVGVHENMCVIGRSFGLRNMVHLGKNVVLVRDLTDAMYNPQKPPHVSHVRGTELVCEHIEKYVCPTVTSSDLLGGPAFRFKIDTRPHVTLIASDDEYFSERTLPAFADLLREQYGCYCTPLVSDRGKADLPGLDELKTTDVLMLFVRRRALPKEQLDKIRAYLDAGKPLVALRTCSHAFVVEAGKQSPPGTDQWPEFDHDVLGGNYHSYVKSQRESEMHLAPDAVGHPILAGVAPPEWKSIFPLYFVSPLAADAKVLVIGEAAGKTEPVAWVRSYKGARVFYASLGSDEDFASIPQFRTMMVNTIFWAMDRPVPTAR
jgi:nicotinamidase-related amidase